MSEEDCEYVRLAHRVFRRANAWAIKQPPEALAVHFAGVFRMYRLHRRFYRDACAQADRIMDELIRSDRTLAEKEALLVKYRHDRRRGAEAAKANSPIAAAKSAAQQLWPEASRKGWTAPQFHTAISQSGHSVAFDTARKWLTSLRKTGAC